MRNVKRHLFAKLGRQPSGSHRYTGKDLDPPKRSQWAVFLIFVALLKRYWSAVLLIVILTWLVLITRLVWPWLGKIIFDEVLPNRNWELFYVVVGINVGLYIFNQLCKILRQIYVYYCDLWIMAELRAVFFDRMARLSLSFMQNRPVGEHFYRASSDIEAVMFMITDLIPNILMAIFEFVTVFILLSYLDWRIGMIVIIYMVPYTGLSHWIASLVRRFDRQAREKWQASQAVLQDGLAGKTEVKVFARRRYEVGKFLSRNIVAWRAQMKRQYLYIAQSQVVGNGGFIPWFMSWGIKAWFLREVINGHITYGSLLPIFAYMNQFRNPLQTMVELIQKARINLIPAERILETMDVSPVVVDKPGASDMPALTGSAEFKNVDFSYEDGTRVLQGVDFSIEPGTKVSFVGASGAGKSTVIKLLLRLYDPDDGAVALNGIDLKDVRMDTVQGQIGLVSQDTHVFIGTVRENLHFSNADATEEELWEALRTADLEQVVREMPEGLDTDLQEGSALSGGQRQRLGIARALVRTPKLLLLDEPTSSLDSETEAHVLNTLAKTRAGRTTVLVSHRLPTVVDSDVIYVMDQGRIVESGTHDELLKAKGVYEELYGLYAKGIADS